MQLRDDLPATLSLPTLNINDDAVNQAIDSLMYQPYTYFVEPRGIVKYEARKPVMIVRAHLRAPEFCLVLGDRSKIRRVIEVERFVGELKLLGANCTFERYNDLDHLLHFVFWFNVSSNGHKACCSASSAADGRSMLLMLYAKSIAPGVIYKIKLLDRALAETLERNKISRLNRRTSKGHATRKSLRVKPNV